MKQWQEKSKNSIVPLVGKWFSCTIKGVVIVTPHCVMKMIMTIVLAIIFLDVWIRVSRPPSTVEGGFTGAQVLPSHPFLPLTPEFYEYHDQF